MSDGPPKISNSQWTDDANKYQNLPHMKSCVLVFFLSLFAESTTEKNDRAFTPKDLRGHQPPKVVPTLGAQSGHYLRGLVAYFFQFWAFWALGGLWGCLGLSGIVWGSFGIVWGGFGDALGSSGEASGSFGIVWGCLGEALRVCGKARGCFGKLWECLGRLGCDFGKALEILGPTRQTVRPSARPTARRPAARPPEDIYTNSRSTASAAPY